MYDPYRECKFIVIFAIMFLMFSDHIQFGHTKRQEHQRLAFCIPILIDPSNVFTSTLEKEVPEKYCPVNLSVSEDTVAGKHVME